MAAQYEPGLRWWAERVRARARTPAGRAQAQTLGKTRPAAIEPAVDESTERPKPKDALMGKRAPFFPASTMDEIAADLHRAADRMLWAGVGPPPTLGKQEFSCAALCETQRAETFQWVAHLGVRSWSDSEFNEFERGRERQAARYLWLKWAALMAEQRAA
jgi:hypothetical protein